jgi:hypothetical protein
MIVSPFILSEFSRFSEPKRELTVREQELLVLKYQMHLPRYIGY